MLRRWPDDRGNPVGPGLVELTLGDKTVCLVPRAASQAMRHAMRQDPKLLPDVPEGNTRIMWIREPFDRLATALTLFTTNDKRDLSTIVDSILEGHWNIHWIPQTTLHPNVDRYYPFETLNETWPLEFPDIPLDRRNRSHKPERGRPRVPWEQLKTQLTQEQIDGLTAYYAEDTRVYNESRTTR